MPNQPSCIVGIAPSGRDVWKVHFAAMRRKPASTDIAILSVYNCDFDTPTETVEACYDAVCDCFRHYTQLPGLPHLCAAMAKVSARCTSVNTALTEIIATPGIQAVLYTAVPATHDDDYITYHGTFCAASASYIVVEAYAADDFQPRVDEIEKAMRPSTGSILTNTPNNPIGAVYSRTCLEEIARLCVQRDLWLLSEEVYWTFGCGEHVSPRALLGRPDVCHARRQRHKARLQKNDLGPARDRKKSRSCWARASTTPPQVIPAPSCTSRTTCSGRPRPPETNRQ